MFRSVKPGIRLEDAQDDNDLQNDRRQSPLKLPHGRLWVVLALSLAAVWSNPLARWSRKIVLPDQLVLQAWRESLSQCDKLDILPGPPADFNQRIRSDRWVKGTPSTLIRNATIWTGNDNGNEILSETDVFLHHGMIVEVGKNLSHDANVVVEADGAWLTPGIVDMHSHLGVDSLPNLSGSSDTNSGQGPIVPWLRTIDAINTHDLAYKRSVSGGVVASLILPGSANDIAGQAFMIKLRQTKERTPDSLVLEMPYNVKSPGNMWREGDPPRWRHMKMACGENIRRSYKQTRLDLAWNFRSAFDEARKLKQSQDAFCSRAQAARSRGEVLNDAFPDDLKWEALVDVLRGKVKVNTHCYETTDLAAFVRHSNEFQFPIAAFHHAHEAYLVPDLLKSAYNQTPAVAIFATQARYKREAWRGSEYAGKILSDHNITVIMKSDHPVLDSRFLLYEAQQAHHFGLPEHLALASVTSNPANVAGFGHRLGFVRPGSDADVVLWDSHPLRLGATPTHVYIDGISQLAEPYHAKPRSPSREVAPVKASRPKHVIGEEMDDDASEDLPRPVVDT